MSRQKNYLNNKDLLEEIKKSKEKGELTPKALEFLMLLAEKCSLKLSYNNYLDKEDCIAFAKMDLFKYWNSFNPDKSDNPFAYYTEVAKRGFAKGWNKLHPKKYSGTVSISGCDNSDGIYTL